jgi:pyruvate kinase
MTQTREQSVGAPTDRVAQLLGELEELRTECLEAEGEFAPLLGRVRAIHRPGARNLVHYVAFRRRDLRRLQVDLAHLGLSSLGRAEAHVLASLDTVIGVLRRLSGAVDADDAPSVEVHASDLARHADRLLGPLGPDRATRVMVTLPSEAARGSAFADDLVKAGMDVARINCAHDTADDWREMAALVRAAAAAQGRTCLIAMDLAGPKLRTGRLPLGPPVMRVAPSRDARGVVLAPARLWLHDGSTSEPPRDGTRSIPVIPVDALLHCHAGDAIVVRDARGDRRRLLITEVLPNGAGLLAETRKTTYFETGLALDVPGMGRARAAVGSLPRREIGLRLRRGDQLVLTRTAEYPDATPPGLPRISCTLPAVFDHARVGHRVWFDDGKIGAVVIEIVPEEMTLQIIDARPGGSVLHSEKGINLPDTELAISALTDQDLIDLVTAVSVADIIDVSFIRTPGDVEQVQQQLADLGATRLGIVLKIETVAGFEQLPEILLTAMRSERIGVMIARGDLAVEAGYERMAEVQEEILWLCEAGRVPVIWATQVLDQLARTGHPSRAEVTDAARAARAECIMLNKGPHIAAAVSTFLDIDRRMRDHQHKKQSLLRRLRAWDHDPT